MVPVMNRGISNAQTPAAASQEQLLDVVVSTGAGSASVLAGDIFLSGTGLLQSLRDDFAVGGGPA